MTKERNATIGGPGSRTELIERAAALAPLVRERATETDRLRRLPDATLVELRETGLNRILQPRRFGGAELDFGAMAEVCSTVARGCGSTGWVLAQYIIHAYMLGSWPPEAQEEVWGGNPGAFLSGVLIFPAARVRKVDGGYRISGRWPFASGVDGADWSMCAGLLEPEKEGELPGMIMFVLPKTDYELIDTWHAMGLRGTGSKDVRLSDHFVPAHRALMVDDTKGGERSPGARFHRSALYRTPVYAVFGFVQGGAALGIAEGMFENYVAETRTRAAKSSGKAISDLLTLQVKIAEASASIEGARKIMLADCAEVMAIAEAGGVPTMEQKTRYRRDGAFVSMLCTRAVDLLYASAGGGALYESSPLARAFRDIHATHAHITMNWDINAAAFGRVMLGLPSDNPTL
jgi:3-hydroxy-9,10-secoandrosta-1,3,5(10)-triene-9,17-dione monooxygenase